MSPANVSVITQKTISEIKSPGFTRISETTILDILKYSGVSDQSITSFTESWNDLKPDQHMADHGKYRERRYGVCILGDEGNEFQKHEPHYQSLDYNKLNGGVERWFEPLTQEFIQNPCVTELLSFLKEVAQGVTNQPFIRAEIHQFRILAHNSIPGQPAPEGIHRDGTDVVFIMMVKRNQIKNGMTTITDLSEKNVLAEFTLERPFEAALVNDRTVMHGVSPITAEPPEADGHRDVFVVTLRAIESR